MPAPAGGLPAAHQVDELGALPLRQATDRLAGRDAAVREDLVDLDAAVFRNGQEEVEDLRGLEERRRVEQQFVDRGAAGLQIPLQLGSPGANVVSALERVHA